MLTECLNRICTHTHAHTHTYTHTNYTSPMQACSGFAHTHTHTHTQTQTHTHTHTPRLCQSNVSLQRTCRPLKSVLKELTDASSSQREVPCSNRSCTTGVCVCVCACVQLGGHLYSMAAPASWASQQILMAHGMQLLSMAHVVQGLLPFFAATQDSLNDI